MLESLADVARLNVLLELFSEVASSPAWTFSFLSQSP